MICSGSIMLKISYRPTLRNMLAVNSEVTATC